MKRPGGYAGPEKRKIIPDFRPPRVIRLAPTALYSSFRDIIAVAEALKEIIDVREYESSHPNGTPSPRVSSDLLRRKYPVQKGFCTNIIWQTFTIANITKRRG